MCKPVTTGKGKHRKTLQRCTTKLTSSLITFKTAGVSSVAVLSRDDVIYATGSANKFKLRLTPHRHVEAGSYTLTLIHGRSQQRETITID